MTIEKDKDIEERCHIFSTLITDSRQELHCLCHFLVLFLPGRRKTYKLPLKLRYNKPLFSLTAFSTALGRLMMELKKTRNAKKREIKRVRNKML